MAEGVTVSQEKLRQFVILIDSMFCTTEPKQTYHQLEEFLDPSNGDSTAMKRAIVDIIFNILEKMFTSNSWDHREVFAWCVDDKIISQTGYGFLIFEWLPRGLVIKLQKNERKVIFVFPKVTDSLNFKKKPSKKNLDKLRKILLERAHQLKISWSPTI